MQTEIESPILYKYQNGNVTVTIHEDGTRVSEWPDDETPHVTHPLSTDCKITDWCDLECPWCHEKSDRKGKHGDLDLIADIWSTQLPGTEMAIGGGNPLSHPDLIPFLKRLKGYGIIPNITVNMRHMRKFTLMISELQYDKLIYGLGISYSSKKELQHLPRIDFSNVVFHLIMGVNTVADCYDVIEYAKAKGFKPKILLLGYKTWGKGVSYDNPKVREHLALWEEKWLNELLTYNGLTLSFDNLAIEQLKLQDKLPKETWDLFYQGHDGVASQYVDAVKKEAARTSTSPIRYPITNTDTIQEIFGKVRI